MLCVGVSVSRKIMRARRQAVSQGGVQEKHLNKKDDYNGTLGGTPAGE